MSVSWKDAEQAYTAYSLMFPGESIEKLEALGGFGVEEFVYFYNGLIGPEEGAWPTDVCEPCRGSGDLDGGKCRLCHGAGALLPKENPGTPVR